MADINKDFLEKLEKEFNRLYSNSKKINALVKKLKDKKATCEDAFEYAKEVGNIRKSIVRDYISEDILNNGFLGYQNANALFNDILYKNYELINQYCKNTFTQVNKNAGINLNGLSVDYDQDRTDGIIECAVKDVYSKVRNETEEAIYTNAKCYYDLSLQKNVEFQGKSGLNPVIIRTTVGKTCKWCQSLAGTYNYLDDWDPFIYDNIYKRHSNCDCMVVYSPRKGKYQDVWSKSWMKNKQYEKEKVKRIEFVESKDNRPNVLENLYFSQEDDLVKPSNIENDFSDCMPLNLSEKEKDVFGKLYQLSKENDVEYLAYYHRDGNVDYRTDNMHGAVSVDSSLIDNGTKLFHAHTSDSPISHDDILQLYRNEVEEIGVVCNNMDVFTLSVGDGYLPDTEELDVFLESIDEDIVKTLIETNGFYELDLAERNYIYYSERLFRAVREYGWTYRGGKLNE